MFLRGRGLANRWRASRAAGRRRRHPRLRNEPAEAFRPLHPTGYGETGRSGGAGRGVRVVATATATATASSRRAWRADQATGRRRSATSFAGIAQLQPSRAARWRKVRAR